MFLLRYKIARILQERRCDKIKILVFLLFIKPQKTKKALKTLGFQGLCLAEGVKRKTTTTCDILPFRKLLYITYWFDFHQELFFGVESSNLNIFEYHNPCKVHKNLEL